ncbi:MAG: hypothetical protein U9O83_02515 [Campylobacterota bacterium]|nr:hypothetical protein [Campylobacterota bacterium]
MEYLAQEILDFTSTNITARWADYNPSTTYTLEEDTSNLTDDSVVLYENYYYRSLVTGNVGFNPIEYLGTKWIKWDVSNRYAMIDLSSQSKSTTTGENLVVVFERNNIETLGLGNFEASQVVIEHLDSDGTTVLETQTLYYSVNEDVVDYYTYIYTEYSEDVGRGIKIDIAPTGTYIRVTFVYQANSNQASCGYLVGGQPIDMGCTLTDIDFSFNSFATKEQDEFGTLTIVKRSVQDLVDFETVIENTETQSIKREIKKIYNDIVVFIIDPSDTSIYENLLTLGTVENAGVVISEFTKTHITWSVMEAI